MIQDVGNIELCKLLETEPKKRSEKYVYHTGTLASSIAPAGISCVKGRGEKSEIHQVHDGPSFNSRLRHQERTTSRTSIW